jgi:hypothetical protein
VLLIGHVHHVSQPQPRDSGHHPAVEAAAHPEDGPQQRAQGALVGVAAVTEVQRAARGHPGGDEGVADGATHVCKQEGEREGGREGGM